MSGVVKLALALVEVQVESEAYRAGISGQDEIAIIRSHSIFPLIEQIAYIDERLPATCACHEFGQRDGLPNEKVHASREGVLSIVE